MRGQDDRSEGFFCYVRLEERIPADHTAAADHNRPKADSPSKHRHDFERIMPSFQINGLRPGVSALATGQIRQNDPWETIDFYG